jgi:hypothetical protein
LPLKEAGSLLIAVVEAAIAIGKVDAAESAANGSRCTAAEVNVPECTADESRRIVLVLASKEAPKFSIALAEAAVGGVDANGQVLE